MPPTPSASSNDNSPRPYTGPWPIQAHRNMAQVWADEARLELFFRNPEGRIWCDQCERHVLPAEGAACQDRFCKAKQESAA